MVVECVASPLYKLPLHWVPARKFFFAFQGAPYFGCLLTFAFELSFKSFLWSNLRGVNPVTNVCSSWCIRFACSEHCFLIVVHRSHRLFDNFTFPDLFCCYNSSL